MPPSDVCMNASIALLIIRRQKFSLFVVKTMERFSDFVKDLDIFWLTTFSAKYDYT
jgi:hypothetical protein